MTANEGGSKTDRSPPRYGTSDDALARLLAERRERARPQSLWPGAINAALIAALICFALWLKPVHDAVAALSDRAETAAQAERALDRETEISDRRAYRAVRSSLEPVFEKLQPLLAPLCANEPDGNNERRRSRIGVFARLRALSAWAELHMRFRRACERRDIDPEAYRRAARRLDPLDRLLLEGANGYPPRRKPSKRGADRSAHRQATKPQHRTPPPFEQRGGS